MKIIMLKVAIVMTSWTKCWEFKIWYHLCCRFGCRMIHCWFSRVASLLTEKDLTIRGNQLITFKLLIENLSYLPLTLIQTLLTLELVFLSRLLLLRERDGRKSRSFGELWLQLQLHSLVLFPWRIILSGNMTGLDTPHQGRAKNSLNLLKVQIHFSLSKMKWRELRRSLNCSLMMCPSISMTWRTSTPSSSNRRARLLWEHCRLQPHRRHHLTRHSQPQHPVHHPQPLPTHTQYPTPHPTPRCTCPPNMSLILHLHHHPLHPQYNQHLSPKENR